MYRFFHVFGAATGGFEVQDAVVWSTRLDVSPETGRDMDHAQRQMRRLGDPGGGDVHEVFQTPGLFGIPDVPRNLAPQTIRGYEGRVRQVHVTAAQDDMGAGLRVPVRLRHDDDMQRLRAFLVEQLPLGQAGLDMPRHEGLFEIVPRDVVVRHLVAILALGNRSAYGPV